MNHLQSFDSERVEELYHEVDFFGANLRHAAGDLRSAGRFSQEMSDTLRGLAIMQLLLDADIAAFAACLRQSAEVRRDFLGRCRAAGHESVYTVASYAAPFFDAIACGAVELAGAIASLSSPTYCAGKEYEDDYCYVRCLQLLFLGRRDEAHTMLKRFRANVTESSSGRLAVCEALSSGDGPDVFDDAFEDMLANRDEEVETLRRGPAIENACLAVECHLFIEGLAVLEIARRHGFVVGKNFRYCAPVARVAAADTFRAVG